jgi:uracil-DNA glycosylase
MPAAMPDQAVANDPGGVRLHPSWRRWLDAEFQLPYMQALRAFLAEEKRRRKVIYPRGASIFAALDSTPFEQVRVVIIGQDPYHGPGQAHGLCFSVQPGVPEPPSLHNIFAEINDDLGALDEAEGRTRRRIPPGRGCLSSWAQQGVLLLNAVLTVEHGRAGSHQGKGWERFTDRIVSVLNDERDGLVFLLWGGYAQRKGAIVDARRHLVLTAPHPSPLSAHRGFLGCRHFSQADRYLAQQGQAPIDWFAVA